MQNNTSIEEDTELRDLVAQTLENKGILPKIRAQIRASVFCALEENSDSKEALIASDDFSGFFQQPLASVVLNLIRQFLMELQLDFTLSVFEPETRFRKDYNEISKEKILKQYSLEEYNTNNPILYEIIAKILKEARSSQKGNIDNGNPIQNFSVNGTDTSLNDDGGVIPTSPLDLNSTYVKSVAEKNSPISLDGIKPSEDADDNYDSIDEVLPSNKSSSAEHSARDLEQSGKAENNENSNTSSPDEKSKTPDKVESKNAAAEIDLLTFTPVKEIKTTEKTVPLTNKGGVEEEGKSKQNFLSVLGDLPPLNAKSESKKNQINEIKAIIDQGLDLDKVEEDSTSPSSKEDRNQESSAAKSSGKRDKSHNSHVSEKSDKSETIDGEEFEDDDDLSDLINSRASSDNQFTVDETISKMSNVGDHLESV